MLASRTISSRADGSANLTLRGLSPRRLHGALECCALFGSPPRGSRDQFLVA